MADCSHIYEKLTEVMKACFRGKCPVTDNDLFIFYSAIDRVKKAISQSAASILMEDDLDDSKFIAYVNGKKKRLEELSDAFHYYIFQVKGYDAEHFYNDWLEMMKKLYQNNAEWNETIKTCTSQLSSFIFE